MNPTIAMIARVAHVKAFAAVGAGVGIGVGAGITFVAVAGFVSPTPPGIAGITSGAPLMACAGDNTTIGRIAPESHVLVTGRTADGRWLQVYYSTPWGDRAWTPTGPLKLAGDASTLPVAPCNVASSPRPTGGVADATSPPSSTPIATPSTKPTPGVTPRRSPTPDVTPGRTPTTTPAVTPRNTRPKVAGFSASTKTMAIGAPKYCPGVATTVPVSVVASDDLGVAAVTLHWTIKGVPDSKPMVESGNTWKTTLSESDGISKAGSLAVWAVATDASGLNARTANKSVNVRLCSNAGPAIEAPVIDPTTIFTNPLRTTCGPSRTSISAKVVDIDGVASVTASLTGLIDAPLDLRRDGDAWSAVFDATAARIVESGTVKVVLRALDNTGKSSTKTLAPFNVRRCDSEAEISVQDHCSQIGADIVRIFILAADPDSSPKDLKVTVNWEASQADPPGPNIVTGQTPASWTGNEWLYVARIELDLGEQYYELNGSISTQDPFGGSSRRRFPAMIVPGTSCVE